MWEVHGQNLLTQRVFKYRGINSLIEISSIKKWKNHSVIIKKCWQFALVPSTSNTKHMFPLSCQFQSNYTLCRDTAGVFMPHKVSIMFHFVSPLKRDNNPRLSAPAGEWLVAEQMKAGEMFSAAPDLAGPISGRKERKILASMARTDQKIGKTKRTVHGNKPAIFTFRQQTWSQGQF